MSKDNKIFVLIFTLVALAALLLFFSSCNPVKRVLKDPFKTQQVFDEGVKLGWCVNDSIYVSDTTILLDTLHVIESTTDTLKVDSVVYITKTDYKTITMTRDIEKKVYITDNSRISLLQKEVSKHLDIQIKLKQDIVNIEEKEKQARKERNNWRLRCWILGFAFIAWLLRKPILKLIKPL